MMFRTRLLLIFTIAIVAASAGGTAGTGHHATGLRTRRSAARQRARAAIPKGVPAPRQEIVRAVNAIAASNDASDIAIASDPARYYDAAPPLAASHGLDLLELVAADGTIVSSAEWPARFNYHEDWITAPVDWKQRGAFLRREELPQGCRAVAGRGGGGTAGDRRLYVTGGQQLDREFLSTLSCPPGMRVLLYRNLAPEFVPAELIDANGPCATPPRCAR